VPGIYNNVLTVLKFIQGDKEVEMELPISPLCDRKNTMISESQIGMVIFLSHLRIREFTFSEVFFKKLKLNYYLKQAISTINVCLILVILMFVHRYNVIIRVIVTGVLDVTIKLCGRPPQYAPAPAS